MKDIITVIDKVMNWEVALSPFLGFGLCMGFGLCISYIYVEMSWSNFWLNGDFILREEENA